MLQAFEERVRRQGIPVERWLNPGISKASMDETLEPLGLRLPIEGQVWWEWHDGAVCDGWEKVLGPGNDFLSIAEAVANHERRRRSAEETVVPAAPPFDDPDSLWNPAWLRICGDAGNPIVIDCSVSEGDPTPIRMIDWQNVDGFSTPRARSLGEMVRWWIMAIDLGVWSWNRELNRWARHDELRDEALRNISIV